MAHPYFRKKRASSQVPRGGWALKKFIVDQTIEAAGESGLLDALEAARPASSPDPSPGHPYVYSNKALLRVEMLRLLERKRYANDLVEFLEESAQARMICGFVDGQTPGEATVSRFARLLSRFDKALWDTLMAVNLRITDIITGGKETGGSTDDVPSFGEILAIDSTDIEAFSDLNRKRHIDPFCPKPDRPDECRSNLSICCKPSDPNAARGVRTDQNSPTGVSPFFGYKLHTIGDAYYGTPLCAVLLPANESDTKQLIPLMKEVLERYPRLSPKYLLADRGYDSTENFVWLDSKGVIPVIAVRNLAKKAKGDKYATYEVEVDGPYGVYIREFNEDGHPLCVNNEPMEYVGSHPEGMHLFRCAKDDCRLNKRSLFPMYCEEETWLEPEGKLLRIVGRLPRFTKLWKELYRLRQTIERFFGSAKRSRLLNRQQYLTMGKVGMRAAMSLLSYSATMLARLMAGDHTHMLHMRV